MSALPRLVPILLTCLSSAAGAQERPYTEGPVVATSYVRIKPGMFDKYMKYLATDYKRTMEAQKKEGIILDYAVFSSPQTREGDWNMILTITYKNMAALDNLRDRSEPIALRTTNRTVEQAAQANIERGEMRELVGNRLLRQLILK
jgi:hypothetical protein